MKLDDYLYYETEHTKLYNADCLEAMKLIDDNSIDLCVTDPPYGIRFMYNNKKGKGITWDTGVPCIEIWTELLRILKDGAFAFIMSSPRQDVQCQMILNLREAGFELGFSPIYWTFASGFPKRLDIGKAIDKKLGAEREIIDDKGKYDKRWLANANSEILPPNKGWNKHSMEQVGKDSKARFITAPTTPQAKQFDGSYGGCQLKPAVEIILVAMKPMTEKTFAEQALKNGKGITWQDDCAIPFNDYDKNEYIPNRVGYKDGIDHIQIPTREKDSIVKFNEAQIQKTFNSKGRCPANLLVSDDVLNDGNVTLSSGGDGYKNSIFCGGKKTGGHGLGDIGQFSRYFSLDSWWQHKVMSHIKELPKSVQKTFPFLIVSKASKSEKNIEKNHASTSRNNLGGGIKNNHPTAKPVKLMSYLTILGSRQGDTVIDPFAGSGTLGIATEMLNRNCILIEREKEYCEISKARLKKESSQTKLAL